LKPDSPRFKSVILDVDSTLCGVEGIDWLARRRGADVAAKTTGLTQRAMNGEITLESVYGERLALIKPTLRDIAALSEEYRRTLASGAEPAIAKMRAAGVHVVLVSGGIRRAIEPVALELGLPRDDLFAVELRWDESGEYVGYDTESPLTTQHGKLDVVRSLRLDGPKLAVGDGATDVEMREAVDAFAAFTGFVRRASIVKQADFVVATYHELARRVLAA
jgi:HAD superfamily phosphoserine phosphatase-like hydrolase